MILDGTLFLAFSILSVWMIVKYRKIILGYILKILIMIELIIFSGFVSQLVIFLIDDSTSLTVVRHWLFIEITA